MAAKKNKGLGKGLGALFDDIETSVPVSDEVTPTDKIKIDELIYVDINDIKPNGNQPRQTFDKETLEELAGSIKTHGLLEPIIIRKAKKGYELVAGERRWRAMRIAGKSVIPARLMDITDEQNMLLALIENVQREDLNAMDEAEAFKSIMEINDMTQNDVAATVGKSRAYVANLLRLIKLPEGVRDYIRDGKLTGGHGKAIGMINGHNAQLKMADRVVKDKLSVHDVERLASEMPESGARKKIRTRKKSKEIEQIEDELTSAVGGKVVINATGNKGKLELYYYSKDELSDLIDMLRSVAK